MIQILQCCWNTKKTSFYTQKTERGSCYAGVIFIVTYYYIAKVVFLKSFKNVVFHAQTCHGKEFGWLAVDQVYNIPKN